MDFVVSSTIDEFEDQKQAAENVKLKNGKTE